MVISKSKSSPQEQHTLHIMFIQYFYNNLEFELIIRLRNELTVQRQVSIWESKVAMVDLPAVIVTGTVTDHVIVEDTGLY